MFYFWQQLETKERKTFFLHTIYSSIDGIILGVLALNEFVFLKSIHGSNLQVGLLFQFSVLLLTFSVFFNEWLKRIKKKGKFIFKTGLITRLPLIILLFFPKEIVTHSNYWLHVLFLTVFFIYYAAHPIIFPTINLMLKSNYSHNNFSRLYSITTSLNKIIMMLVTFAYGVLLDYIPWAYTYVFPFIAILAIYSLWMLSKIELQEESELPKYEGLWKSLLLSVKEMQIIMQNNKAFRDFETGFMFYGFAFMGTVSVITIYFEKELHLNYTSLAFYKNIYNVLAILLLPFFGKLLGKIDPRRFASITYLSLLFYLLFIALTQVFPQCYTISGIMIYPSLIFAMLSNGVFAATMSLLWSIGSAYFCKDNQTLHYQSIHLTFTGLRSFFAPFLGIIVYEWFGFIAAFVLGIIFLLIAIVWMQYSKRNTAIKI